MDIIIELGFSLLRLILITVTSWFIHRMSQNEKMKTIASALEELTSATEQTVLQLQQTTVERMKAECDGKLTPQNIKALGVSLQELTREKMSKLGWQVLERAKVDINAYVQGACEAMLTKIKNGEFDKKQL